MINKKELIHWLITILQVIVFISSMYFIIDWHLNEWDKIGMKPQRMPVESLCVGSILISILIVSIIDKIRPKN